MTELLTAAQMREIERAAIESGKVTGLELMERAGKGAVDAIFAEWPELEGGDRRAVVLCGPGNNGGDGFVVARLLAERGWDVEVFIYGDPDKLPPDAWVNYERWCKIGAGAPLPSGFWLPRGDVVIDALFGTGLSRPLDEASSYTLSYLNKANPHLKLVAIDIPSGLCADSGRSIGVAGRSDLTVTFHRAKHGHYLGDGPSQCGRVRVIDIGLPVPFFDTIDELIDGVNSGKFTASSAQLTPGAAYQDQNHDPVAIVSPPEVLGGKANGNLRKSGADHKYDHGHALILSGGVGRGGAVRMAARAALRVGAGLVTLGCPPAALIENAAQLNAVMLCGVKDAATLTGMLEDTRLNALALGPGLGLTDRTTDLLRVALGSKRATVLDADALTLIAQHDDLRALVHEDCVLTPHTGEFSRLFPDVADRLNAPPKTGPAYSQVDAARDAAKRIGATVLLKGPATVIATPGGRAAINAAVYDRACPWLATAGAGDVLTGLIAGLLAREHSPFKAACTAAWLHTEAARNFGPGLIAEDLPDLIPRVMADLGV